ncbi:hypothetical protein [Sphingomonas abietis]|uniref:Uncharacterized protein n=1 Tax=Sphingomonas abietis TaxID=3012344 RepID=A0ABY7NQT9_9SPHN|nr:hypothetical protein [Sphingomonas abietis]WBO23906.1 hypothetical protein PBT88_07300 [Sphingomonas abietis]
MTEAEKYTTEMWQRHTGELVSMMVGTEGQRRAFIHGFNGDAVKIHHTHRGPYERGRHTAVLLGFLQ